MIRRLVAFLALTLLVAACEVFPMGAPVWTTECTGLPAGMCEQSLRDAEREAKRRVPGAVGVRVRCVIPRCTVENGEMESEALLPDGRTVSLGGAAWASPVDPPLDSPVAEEPPAVGSPPVEPTCEGVPRERCEELAADATADHGDRVLLIVVRCTAACDDRRGEGETLVELADGTSSRGHWEYESSP